MWPSSVSSHPGRRPRRGRVHHSATTYAYDGLNRLITVTYPATPATSLTPAAPSTFTTYTYDFRNNVIDTTTGSTSQQNGHTTHNEYYANGWLKSVTTTSDVPADARTTSYAYYNDGRKASETDPRQHTTNYAYDPAGRLITVTYPIVPPASTATTTTYAYDDAGNQTSVTTAYDTPMAATTSSGFDARRRLLTTTYPIVPPASTATTTQYTYDGPGNLIQVIDQANNQVQYNYDLNNQLTKVTQASAPDPAPKLITTYGYDTNGNLTSLEDANTHVTTNVFDAFNQLQQEAMPATPATQSQTRTYDAAANAMSGRPALLKPQRNPILFAAVLDLQVLHLLLLHREVEQAGEGRIGFLARQHLGVEGFF